MKIIEIISHKYLLLKKKISLCIIMIELLLIFNIFLYDSILDCFNKIKIEINTINKTDLYYNDIIFNLIENDYYNMSLIYNYSYYSIKIKHIRNIKYLKDNIVCVFGILANEKGLEIANSMIKWLLPEYDIYCVYQKYPGKLFEFPALRFAQWLSLTFNINIILYLHTKGAFHYEHATQEQVRKLWKLEFTSPRKKIYIELLKKNITDISLPFRYGACTWFNGMFISNRAFNLINTIQYYKYDRRIYESLFLNKNIRFRGILNDKIPSNRIGFEHNRYINKKYFENKKKYQTIELLILLFSFLLFIIYIKLLFLLL